MQQAMHRVLCIGGTGHIGGAVLHELVGQHGEDHVRVTVLVQSEAKGRRLAEKYPRVRTIVGSMGEHDKVERACRDADVVVNTSPDITHDEGIRAILRGLQEAEDGEGSRGGRKRSRRAYYVHTSGASLIWDEPRGSGEGRWWDDVEDVGELCGFGDECTHAVTDRIVREAAGVVNVAIVSPGFVGGLSPSIEHPTPITMPAIMTTAKAFRSGFQIARGENISAWIHVEDLASMFMILVNDALAALATPVGASSVANKDVTNNNSDNNDIKSTADDDNRQLWGPEAYYFGAAENVPFADLMGALVPALHARGVIESSEVASVDVGQAARISLAGHAGVGHEGRDGATLPVPPPDSWAMHIAIMYGVNMRLRASRMQRLGWRAVMGSVVDYVPEVVSEYVRLHKDEAV